MTKKKIRKCGYARVSTKAEEQEHSLVFQTQYYKTLIESERDSEFVGIYADTRSGKTARLRKQFKAMIQACRRGEIDYIYTKSIARFARNLVETLKVIRELRDINVGIIFEKESIDTLDYKSDFMISIYSLVAEKELNSMGENVKWAARRRYAEGSVELAAIYGYDNIDGKLIIRPDEAAVVREVFERYASGEGDDKIARALNGRGLKRKFSARLWGSETVKRMLENEKYVGDALLQKTYKNENFKTVKNDGTVPQYYVENNHPASIDRTTWNAVQAEMERRVTLRTVEESGKGRYSGQYAFSGKIECGCCGAGFRRHHAHGTGLWTCKQHIKAATLCAALPIKGSVLEAAFVRTLNGIIQNRDGIIGTVGEAVNEALASGEQIFYDIYTDTEKAADSRKADTGLFFFRGEQNSKFAITYAGGGFSYVGAMHDSFPHALELSKRGYNAFAIIYRPDAQSAYEDLARQLLLSLKTRQSLVWTQRVILCGAARREREWRQQ
jgi:DNA invertase Pin-like site-specific DNA recombinase